MSSHDMSVRASLKAKPEVTLPVIWASLTRFTDRFRNDLVDGEAVPDFGEMPLSNPDDNIELQPDGTLFLYLNCRASYDSLPDELDSLCEALDRLIVGGGAIEIIDHDTSPANDECISVRFVGADDTQRIHARLAYGLGLAREWLVDVLDPSGFEQVSQLAKSLADARLAKA